MRIGLAPLLFLALFGCADHRPFDAAVWKADRLTDSRPYLTQRRAMLDDLLRRFPPGSSKSEILRTLGSAESELDCGYPDADSCLAYDLGVRSGSIDYEYFEFRFRRDRLVEAYIRQG